MNVAFTPTFVNHMKRIAAKSEFDGIYIYTKRVGCNGLAYAFDPTKAKANGNSEHYFEVDGLEFVISKADEAVFEGCTFDYVRQGLNFKVVVDNPNAKSACGCGESFNLA